MRLRGSDRARLQISVNMNSFGKNVVETAYPTIRFVSIALAVFLVNQVGCRAALQSNPDYAGGAPNSVERPVDNQVADASFAKQIPADRREAEWREAEWREADRREAERRSAIRRETDRIVADQSATDQRATDRRATDRRATEQQAAYPKSRRRGKLRVLTAEEIWQIENNTNAVEQASYRQANDGYPADSLLDHVKELETAPPASQDSGHPQIEAPPNPPERQVPARTPFEMTASPALGPRVRGVPPVISMQGETRQLDWETYSSDRADVLNIRGQVLNPREKLASQKALELVRINQNLLGIIDKKSAHIRHYESTIQDLENRLYQSDRTVARLRAEIEQVQGENLTLRSKLRLAEEEKVETKRQTDETLGQIESKLDGLLLNKMSTITSPPTKQDKN